VRQALEKKAEARVGEVLKNKWRVDRLLDVGGMAAVYASTHRNGNRVALKVLHPIYAHDPETRRRFLEEGYVANRVNHPDTVRVLDDDVLDDGTAFLVMELLEGQSLEARLKRCHVLAVPAVLFIAHRVLDVLAAGHDQGIIHRDIKPPNVFLTNGGEVKVLDFGLARVRERNLKGSLTKTGMVVGTASYMPPEQARGKRDLIDARTDVWAVGATMFRALTGHYVHEGDTVNERLLAAMSQKARSILTVLPKLKTSVAAAVDVALSFQPKDRWQGARQMHAALGEAYLAVTGKPMPEPAQSAGPDLFAKSVPSAKRTESGALDIPISVVFDPDPAGSSLMVELEDDAGNAERFELRRTAERPMVADGGSDDALSDVTIVEVE
jgi:serine/threonine-protein kinase